jgi:hypothetical protein
VVVVDPPGLDDPPSGSQVPEQVLIQAFIPKPFVEAFHEPILLRLTERDAASQHPLHLLPA